MKQETKEWMNKALDDFATAKDNLRIRRYSASGFFSQQACEKALKAMQIEKFGKFDRIHDLVKLAKSINAPNNIIIICERISPVYIATRYPDSSKEVESKNYIENIVKDAKKVILWARQILK